MWTEDDTASVANGAALLNPDGSGANIFTVTDAEHEIAARVELDTGTFDKIILVDE